MMKQFDELYNKIVAEASLTDANWTTEKEDAQGKALGKVATEITKLTYIKDLPEEAKDQIKVIQENLKELADLVLPKLG